eukprot:7816892-Pyramimonas_sp.AAC.1
MLLAKGLRPSRWARRYESSQQAALCPGHDRSVGRFRGPAAPRLHRDEAEARREREGEEHVLWLRTLRTYGGLVVLLCTSRGPNSTILNYLNACTDETSQT